MTTPQSSQSLVRRSTRLASKPTPKYFSSDEDIVTVLETRCDKKGWLYSDALVTEYKAWRATASKLDTEKYDWRTGKYVAKDESDCILYWANYYSTTLKNQARHVKLNNALRKYCEEKSLKYSHSMLIELDEWVSDPANKNDINYVYYTDSLIDPVLYQPRSASHCVSKWFSTKALA